MLNLPEDFYWAGLVLGMLGFVGERWAWLLLAAYSAVKLGLVHLPTT